MKFARCRTLAGRLTCRLLGHRLSYGRCGSHSWASCLRCDYHVYASSGTSWERVTVWLADNWLSAAELADLERRNAALQREIAERGPIPDYAGDGD